MNKLFDTCSKNSNNEPEELVSLTDRIYFRNILEEKQNLEEAFDSNLELMKQLTLEIDSYKIIMDKITQELNDSQFNEPSCQSSPSQNPVCKVSMTPTTVCSLLSRSLNEAEINKITDKVKIIKNNTNELTKQVEQYKQMYFSLKKDNDNLLIFKGKAEPKIKKLEDDLKKAEQDLKKAETDIKKFDQELKITKKDMELIKQNASDLASNNDMLKNQVRDKTEEMRNALRDVEKLEKTKKKAEMDLEKGNKDLEIARNDLAKIKNDMDKEKSIRAGLEKEVERLKKEAKDLINVNLTLERDNDKMKKELKDCKDNLEKGKKDLKYAEGLKQVNDEMKERIANLENEIESLNEKLINSSGKKDENADSYGKYQEIIEELKQDNEKKCKALMIEIDRLKDENYEKTQEIDNLKVSDKAFHEKNSFDDSESSSERIQVPNLENEELKMENERLQDENQKLSEMCELQDERLKELETLLKNSIKNQGE
ncbi:hypothetical protein SteCoe_27128 [Stentor coeruleus]|uniref:Uncharacterized protein n=1 Tax=Stentor coeruleus TaxID=5963 RepID=A0A1R2BB98_9CILI|nr:hypothetical protein SteCoe_27128 [Stentor coeruleus]